MRNHLVLLLVLATPSWALPAPAAYPGGIAVLELGTGERPPVVRFDGRRVLTVHRDGRWLALVGIPLEHAPGDASVSVNDGAQQRHFVVARHAYREQHLEVAPSFVNPDPPTLQRIAAERRRLDAALSRFSPQAPPVVTLDAPLPGRRSDSFGSRRFFNGEARSPHRGMDIAGSAGMPVRAPLDATVVVCADLFFTGNTVLLDHGQGLLTLYAHLQDIDVEEGQAVATGDRLGTVGASGRATGAHLHFGTYLNGVAVDPALLLNANDSRPAPPAAAPRRPQS